MLLLPDECKERILQHEIKELARFLTELSVCDYFFVTKRPSSIALAAILNGFSILGESQVSTAARDVFIKRVSNIAGYDAQCVEVQDCQQRLQETYYQSGFDETGLGLVEEEEDVKGRYCSPVCVSDMSEINHDPIEGSQDTAEARSIVVAPTNLNEEFQQFETLRRDHILKNALVIED